MDNNMGILGDKMLSAGIIAQSDIERVHRQEIITKEQKRKNDERRKSKKDQERKIAESASLVANTMIKDCILESLGFTEDERVSLIYKTPEPSLELIFRLGSISDKIISLLTSKDTVNKINIVRDELIHNNKFRKDIIGGL